jgi:hypothetical protein
MKKSYSLGQSILEYTVVLAVVAAAVAAMQLYFKRGVQSAIKVAADQVGTQEGGDSIDTSDGLARTQSGSQHVDTITSGSETEQVSAGSRSKSFSSTTTTSGSSVSLSEEEQ